jgi:hypothetical protein
MTETKIQESIRLIKEAAALYDKTVQDAFQPGLQYIAENYGNDIDIITIIGYTPGFNDGEPCEHSSDYMFGYSDLENYGGEYLMEDWFEDQEELIEKLLEKEVKVPAEVKTFVATALDEYFEKKLGTNYRVHIIFENGTYRIEEDEYDCGY